jgi:hypothetical protein
MVPGAPGEVTQVNRATSLAEGRAASGTFSQRSHRFSTSTVPEL